MMPKPHHAQTIGGFSDLREPGFFWYDNTHALYHLFGDPGRRKVLLTRPPRMGKSVFCQMLGAYVDCKTTPDKFSRLFKGTHIERMQEEDTNAKAKLENLQRKCAWLPLVSDWAQRGRPQAEKRRARVHVCLFNPPFPILLPPLLPQTIMATIESTNTQARGSVEDFGAKYDLTGLTVDESDDCVSALRKAIRVAAKANLPLVITIDEYDHLARSSRDGKEKEIALMRDLFLQLKVNPPHFLFVTGIMPLLATELSSATNDVVVITHDSEFADAVGLPQDVVANELHRIAAYHTSGAKDSADNSWERPFLEEMAQFMKEYFNGFRFHQAKKGIKVPAMYNTQQSVAFFRMLTKEGASALDTLHDAQQGLVGDAKMRLNTLLGLFGSGIDTHTQVGEETCQ